MDLWSYLGCVTVGRVCRCQAYCKTLRNINDTTDMPGTPLPQMVVLSVPTTVLQKSAVSPSFQVSPGKRFQFLVPVERLRTHPGRQE